MSITPVDGDPGQRALERLSRRAFPAAQRLRQRDQPEHGADAEHLLRRLHVHHARRPATRSAIWAATRSARRASSNGTIGEQDFDIREGASLQFRSEFFNVLNNTNFGIPNTNTASSAFGTIRSTYPARQIQFALKLLF